MRLAPHTQLFKAGSHRHISSQGTALGGGPEQASSTAGAALGDGVALDSATLTAIDDAVGAAVRR